MNDSIQIQNLTDPKWAVCRNEEGYLYAYDSSRFKLMNSKDLGMVELHPIVDGMINFEMKAYLQRSKLTPQFVQVIIRKD